MKLVAYFIFAATSLAQQPGWFSEKEYENVKVTFDYKLAQWAEASFVLRTPKIGRPIQQGVAVFLAHDFHRKPGNYTTGALAGIEPPTKLLPPTYDKWHTVQLTLVQNRLTVHHNGELLQDTRLPVQKLSKGHLHFADLLHKYEIRNFKATKLEATEFGDKATYVETWSPWNLRDAGTWTTSPNSATGSNGHGINYATPNLKDFLFAVEVKSTNNANGGIFFRGSANKQENRGFEVQIYSPLDSVFPTGSIYGLARSRIAESTEGNWFYMQVLVQGRTCTVWVNGVQIAETTDLPANLTSGQIGLQIHMENTQVQWRNLRALTL